MLAPDLWGGLECTVNRTQDRYLDQSVLSGHQNRPGDLDLFASLGFKALRYPVLWERIAPDDQARPDWRWTDERLPRLRALGIRPIAGLVHHGSGPRHTSLIDDGFAPGLGAFAGRVAERYEWIEDWTPVNEPLTTARFSALYGHWYPHHRDERSFWLALINQIDGTRLAMRAVRRVNAAARLIQTDDLGRVYATLPLAEQAAFENVRRWAGWDLLFGRVTPHHPLWERIDGFGLGDRLRRIADDPCPPDIVGVNHYLTSDRFLDHRLQRYDPSTHGGNGASRYADTEAVRVLDPAPAGIAGVLREAWERYATPLAMTEVHNGCTREEQLRWAAEAWDTAVSLRQDGVDLRAVTAWSLLGSQGWNTLLTTPGVYEPGIYDVSSGTPRPTALAQLWRQLSTGGARHPLTVQPGWWRRPERLIYRSIGRPAGAVASETSEADVPLLICADDAMVGQVLAQACVARGIPYRLTPAEAPTGDVPSGYAALLDAVRPWAVVHAATRQGADAGGGEETRDPVGPVGPADPDGTAISLARACAARAVSFVGITIDQAGDAGEIHSARRGKPRAPIPADLTSANLTSAELDQGARAGLEKALLIRASGVFGSPAADDIATGMADRLARGWSVPAAEDRIFAPTYLPDMVDAALDLLIDGETGVWHLHHATALTWADFARCIAVCCGLDPALIQAVRASTPGHDAPPPEPSAPGSERSGTLPSLERAIERFSQHWERPVRQRSAA